MIQKLLKDFKYTILLIKKIKLFLYKNIKMVKEINHLVIFIVLYILHQLGSWRSWCIGILELRSRYLKADFNVIKYYYISFKNELERKSRKTFRKN